MPRIERLTVIDDAVYVHPDTADLAADGALPEPWSAELAAELDALDVDALHFAEWETRQRRRQELRATCIRDGSLEDLHAQLPRSHRQKLPDPQRAADSARRRVLDDAGVWQLDAFDVAAALGVLGDARWRG